MLNRILFVDDEPMILKALRRGLRRHADRWDMVFASDAAEALERLDEGAADIIVTDVSMPHTDGITLLTQVRERHPDTIRVVLSGTIEGETATRAVPVAHRFLSKPWSQTELVEVLERAFALRDLRAQPPVRALIGRLTALPSIPTVFAELCRVIEDVNAPLERIAAVAGSDPATAGRLLHLVNSAFFGAPRAIDDITDAVRVLGTRVLKNLVLATEVFRIFEATHPPPGFSLEREQAHAAQTARLAAALAPRPISGAAFTGGILHDVGKLLLASSVGDEWSRAHELAAAEGIALDAAEYRVLGASHAEIGAYLLGIWGLPWDVVEAVAHHHQPARADRREPCALAAVHVAVALLDEADGQPLRLDEATAALLAPVDLDRWRALAHRTLSGN